MHDVAIKLSGQPGSGKSTLKRIIEEVLLDRGYLLKNTKDDEDNTIFVINPLRKSIAGGDTL